MCLLIQYFSRLFYANNERLLIATMRSRKLAKMVGTLVEADNDVVRDQLAIVVKSSKLNHEAHIVSQYLMDR